MVQSFINARTLTASGNCPEDHIWVRLVMGFLNYELNIIYMTLLPLKAAFAFSWIYWCLISSVFVFCGLKTWFHSLLQQQSAISLKLASHIKLLLFSPLLLVMGFTQLVFNNQTEARSRLFLLFVWLVLYLFLSLHFYMFMHCMLRKSR